MKLYVTGLAALMVSTSMAYADNVCGERDSVGQCVDALTVTSPGAGVLLTDSTDNSITIIGNYDNIGSGEGVFIRSNGAADNLDGAFISVTGTGTETYGDAMGTVQISGDTVIKNGDVSINTALHNYNTTNTAIGANGNTTSILSDDVRIGTGNYATSVAVGSAAATSVTSKAGTASTVLAQEGEGRWVADANGKLTWVDAGTEGDVAGDTAAMIMTNSVGNTHGLVVQDAKTTISGGLNSSSMTLDDNGATFSNSATGAPIQVHGVADGTAPFDAVNVRQLYGGLAAVLASNPDIRLEPGKAGIGLGMGSYGGYNALGLGLGYMSEDGLVMSGSISKADTSKVAYRASVSYTW